MTISEPIESQRAIPDTIFHKFTVAQLAARWRRTEDDILSMLEAGDMSAYCWYEGYVHSLLQRPDVAAHYYKGWVSVNRDFSCHLLLGKETALSYFSPFIEPPYSDVPKPDEREENRIDVFFPMQQINDNPPDYSEALFSISKGNIIIMGHDVERMEEKNPELLIGGACGNRVNGLVTQPTLTPLEASAATPSCSGQIMVGWKDIAKYLKVSVSTAKRHAKGSRWLHHGPAGKPTTTTAKLDAWLLSPPMKKKKRGAK